MGVELNFGSTKTHANKLKTHVTMKKPEHRSVCFVYKLKYWEAKIRAPQV